MKLDLPLQQMSVAEKIHAMELLWADLSKAAPDGVVPAWHAQVLAEREARFQAGLIKEIPWEEAKGQLRNIIRDLKNT